MGDTRVDLVEQVFDRLPDDRNGDGRIARYGHERAVSRKTLTCWIGVPVSSAGTARVTERRTAAREEKASRRMRPSALNAPSSGHEVSMIMILYTTRFDRVSRPLNASPGPPPHSS